MEPRDASSQVPSVGDRAVSLLRSPRVRLWLLKVPLHLLALVGLYLASARVADSELLSVAGEAAGDRLEEVVREMDLLAATAPTNEAEMGHLIGALIDTQAEVDLQLLLSPEALVDSSTEVSERFQTEVREFFAGTEGQKVWLDSQRGHERMRGLRRISTGPQCAPCHEPVATKAVAAVSLDVTPLVSHVRVRARRNLALLIAAWALLLGVINVVSGRTVKRLSRTLTAQLAAAESGEPLAPMAAETASDPVTAELHLALREFVDRQRHREAEAADRLEKSDQLASLGLLATGLAQEIKGPLAGVQGALEVLRDDKSDRDRGELYDDMLGELGRVDATLRLLRESARPAPPWLASTDPERLVNQTVSLLEPGLRARGILLSSEIGPDTNDARIDPAKVRQVLIHLIQNAADAMEDGGKILVRLGPFPDAEGGIVLTVEDNGPGIPQESLKKIFEPFFTTKFSAAGLGLAIARRLVAQHGGTLEVDSIQGTGTTFYVLIPPASVGTDSSEPERESDPASVE